MWLAVFDPIIVSCKIVLEVSNSICIIIKTLRLHACTPAQFKKNLVNPLISIIKRYVGGNFIS